MFRAGDRVVISKEWSYFKGMTGTVTYVDLYPECRPDFVLVRLDDPSSLTSNPWELQTIRNSDVTEKDSVWMRDDEITKQESEMHSVPGRNPEPTV